MNVHPTPSVTALYTGIPSGNTIVVPAGYARYLLIIESQQGNGTTSASGCGATLIGRSQSGGTPTVDVYLLTSSGTVTFWAQNYCGGLHLYGINS